MKKKVYFVQFEWRTDGVTEFEVLHACETFDIAKECLKEVKNVIINEYTENDNGFEIEKDAEPIFEYQKNEYDQYYIVNIIEKEIEK